MNKVTLFGRLGADPEVRHIASGTAVANLRLATDYRYKNKQTGERESKTEWHQIVAWGRTAEIAGEYLYKGSQVLIEGRLETRKWQDKDGKDRYSTEIQCEHLTLVGGKQGNGERPAAAATPAASAPKEDFEDSIPFAWFFLAPIGSFLVEYGDGASQVLSMV